MNKIISLEISNVMGIRCFYLEPKGNSIVIGGDNEAGKSSVIDTICMVFGGGKLAVPEPIRRGQQKAKAVVTTQYRGEDVFVTRTWEKRPDGTTKTQLEFRTKDGYDAPTPQALLSDMGVLFDPMEFSRMEPKKQLVQLQQLVGLDLTEMDREREVIYVTRTGVNSQLKQKQSLLANTVKHEDAPAAEISASELMVELEKRRQHNAAAASIQRGLEIASSRLNDAHSKEQLARQRVQNLEAELQKAKEALGDAVDNTKKLGDAVLTCRKDVDALVLVDEAEIMTQIKGAEDVNRKVRANASFAVLADEVKSLRERSEALTDEIKALDVSRTNQLAAAKFPVPGLSFSPTGISFNDLPFEQASTAVKIRTSVAVGIASKPGGRVMLIRDGSLLNENNLQLVEDMCAAADCQIWIERVSTGKECTVILEAGEIKAAEPQEVEAAAQ